MEYHVSGQRGYASAQGELIATVARSGLAVAPPQPVPLTEAAAAQAGFPGQAAHPFPTCFACGSSRPGDGLNLRPGPVRGRDDLVACAWFPDPALAGTDGIIPAEIVWSVLDCPGGWTSDLVRVPRVLVSMAARITTLPQIGAGYVITGQLMTITGRTLTSTTALYSVREGDLLASATSIWVAV
jgi:hypothetical protein